MKDHEDENHSVFERETKLLEQARRVLADPPADHEALLKEYAVLTQAYGRLLRGAGKLTRLADSGQNKLIKLKNALEEKNERIEEQHAALQDANLKLEEASLTDPLTGLRNRRYLETFMQKDIEGLSRRLGKVENSNFLFMMLDIDHFKAINDTYGHNIGDMILKQIANQISDNCRRGDIPLRWGGEEFLMVCRDADREFAPNLAERLRSQIQSASLRMPNGEILSCTCSIGFAFYPFFPGSPNLLTWEEIVDLADQGLYAAKRTSRNAWVGVRADEEREVEHNEAFTRNLGHMDRNGLIQIYTSIPVESEILW